MGKENFVDLSHLKAEWPSSIVARTEIRDFTGGAVSEKHLANLDSLGQGPKGRIRLGRKIAYRVDSLISWLEGRATQLN
jgi:hypothetical protein